MKIELPHFGEVNLDYCENEYPHEKNYIHYAYDYAIGQTFGDDFCFQGKPLDLDVHFTDLSQEKISLVAHSLHNLDTIIAKGKTLLVNDFHANGVVKDYIDEWIEYYLEEEIFKGLAKEPFTEETPNELLNKLEVVRIGFYSLAESHSYIVMDFAFGYEIDSGYRDDMLVIKLNKELELMELTTEG